MVFPRVPSSAPPPLTFSGWSIFMVSTLTIFWWLPALYVQPLPISPDAGFDTHLLGRALHLDVPRAWQTRHAQNRIRHLCFSKLVLSQAFSVSIASLALWSITQVRNHVGFFPLSPAPPEACGYSCAQGLHLSASPLGLLSPSWFGEALSPLTWLWKKSPNFAPCLSFFEFPSSLLTDLPVWNKDRTILFLFETFPWLSITYKMKCHLLLWSTSLLRTVLFYNGCSAMYWFVIPWEHQVISKLLLLTWSPGVLSDPCKPYRPSFVTTLVLEWGSTYSLTINVDSFQGEVHSMLRLG